jgi:hypothetical protein
MQLGMGPQDATDLRPLRPILRPASSLLFCHDWFSDENPRRKEAYAKSQSPEKAGKLQKRHESKEKRLATWK